MGFEVGSEVEVVRLTDGATMHTERVELVEEGEVATVRDHGSCGLGQLVSYHFWREVDGVGIDDWNGYAIREQRAHGSLPRPCPGGPVPDER